MKETFSGFPLGVPQNASSHSMMDEIFGGTIIVL